MPVEQSISANGRQLLTRNRHSRTKLSSDHLISQPNPAPGLLNYYANAADPKQPFTNRQKGQGRAVEIKAFGFVTADEASSLPADSREVTCIEQKFKFYCSTPDVSHEF